MADYAQQELRSCTALSEIVLKKLIGAYPCVKPPKFNFLAAVIVAPLARLDTWAFCLIISNPDVSKTTYADALYQPAGVRTAQEANSAIAEARECLSGSGSTSIFAKPVLRLSYVVKNTADEGKVAMMTDPTPLYSPRKRCWRCCGFVDWIFVLMVSSG